MSDQGAMFEQSDPDDRKPWQRGALEDPGRPSVGKAHLQAGEPERRAAVLIMPTSGIWRRRVLDAVYAAGARGMTDYEIHLAVGCLHYTAAPRRKELVDDGWLQASGLPDRPGNSKVLATVYVVTDRGREALEKEGEHG